MPKSGRIKKEKGGRSKRGVKFCPKCGSTGISWARGLPQLWSIWECKNCGYYGAFIVEDGELSRILQREYAEKIRAQEKAGSA